MEMTMQLEGHSQAQLAMWWNAAHMWHREWKNKTKQNNVSQILLEKHSKL